MDSDILKQIKEITEEFLQKMTVAGFNVEVTLNDQMPILKSSEGGAANQAVDLNITLEEEAGILIGRDSQTLFDIQRLLRIMLNKKLQKIFYLNLDINDYKKKKVEYLKSLAKDLADEVQLSQNKKTLFPMSSYERKIMHMELDKIPGVLTESQGEGAERHIVISPK